MLNKVCLHASLEFFFFLKYTEAKSEIEVLLCPSPNLAVACLPAELLRRRKIKLEKIVSTRLLSAYPNFSFIGEEAFVAGSTKLRAAPTCLSKTQLFHRISGQLLRHQVATPPTSVTGQGQGSLFV
jgi:hypothetical protein